MGNYSKLFGTILGGVLGVAVSRFGLPAEFATPDVVSAVTVLVAAAGTYFAPPNQKKKV